MAFRSLRLPVNRRALAGLLCPAAKRHTRHSALPPHPALIGGRFDPPSAGPSLAQGVARLISKPEDAGQLSDGDIRVTTVTNVGWTPIFPGAAAVVTDVGAPLSHAAVVARELSISPSSAAATRAIRLRPGDQIRVDGGKGIVNVVGEAPGQHRPPEQPGH